PVVRVDGAGQRGLELRRRAAEDVQSEDHVSTVGERLRAVGADAADVDATIEAVVQLLIGRAYLSWWTRNRHERFRRGHLPARSSGLRLLLRWREVRRGSRDDLPGIRVLSRKLGLRGRVGLRSSCSRRV